MKPYLRMKKILVFCLICFGTVAQKTENVILITLDGFRWQEVFTGADSILLSDENYVKDSEGLTKMFWNDDMSERRETLLPFFWKTLANEGQLYGNRTYGNKVDVTNGLFFSYPGYNEILTGYADERINSNDKINNPNTTVLEFINNQKAFTGKVAAFGSWDVFPYIINEERSRVLVNAGFEPAVGNLTENEKLLNKLQTEIPQEWSTVRFDAFTHHFAKEYLEKHQPKLLYISYGETDDYAHHGQYDHYLKSAQQTDSFIKGLWEWVQSKEQYKNKTTILITSDHGRGTIPKDTWRSHGKDIVGADEIWLAVIGPDVKVLGEVKSKSTIYQNQIASTVAKLLGQKFENGHKVGKAIETIVK